MKIPPELVVAFGEERVRLTKLYHALTPSAQRKLYDLFVDGDIEASPQLISQLKQFPIKVKGRRITI